MKPPLEHLRELNERGTLPKNIRRLVSLSLEATPSQCLIISRAKHRPKIRYRGKEYLATRVLWELMNGLPEMPDTRQSVCHTCDNPRCCNPHHLFIGTQKDNALDMMKKGRGNFIKSEAHKQKLSAATKAYLRKLPHDYQKGENSPVAKLTWEKVRAIRADRRSQSTIAKDYGVTQTLISCVKLNKIWKEEDRTSKLRGGE